MQRIGLKIDRNRKFDTSFTQLVLIYKMVVFVFGFADLVFATNNVCIDGQLQRVKKTLKVVGKYLIQVYTNIFGEHEINILTTLYRKFQRK